MKYLIKAVAVAAAVLLIGGALMFGFSGCGKKYKVDYGTSKGAFDNAKDSYRAGQKVELYFSMIATDTDYSFYVDGQLVNPKYDNSKGYVIAFTMPEHDVRVGYKSVNSMIYDPNPVVDVCPEVVYRDAIVGTVGGDHGVEITLYTDAGKYSSLTVTTFDAESTKTENYKVPGEAVYFVKKRITELGLRDWQYLEDYECIDGAAVSCRIRNDDGTFTVASTDKMPPDGEKLLYEVRKKLSEYVKDEYKE